MPGDLKQFQRVLEAVRRSQMTSDSAPFLLAREELLASEEPLDPALAPLGERPPVDALRQMARTLEKDMAEAAWACINVAMLLEPENAAVHKQRGLLAMSMLRPAAANASFGRAARGGDAQAALLATYCRLVFPATTFAPIQFPTRPAPDAGEPTAVVRDLGEVRHALQVFATRLQWLRDRMLSMKAKPTASWMVPDMGHMLPEGPLELEAGQRLDRVKPLGTQHQARAEWTTFTWLCWLVGLDDVALPDILEPREEVSTCVDWAAFALWRARDQQQTAGKAAAEEGMPALAWRGEDVGQLPRQLASVVTSDAAAMHAAATWLSDSAVPSPFPTTR